MTLITKTAALSLWELAHRWHNQDPNKSTATDIPLEVQDTLRFLAKAMYDHELRSCNAIGIENWIASDVADFEDFKPYSKDGIPVGMREKHEQWQAHCERVLQPHNDLITGLDEVFVKRRYNPERLDSVYVFQPTMWEYCLEKALTPPNFWFDRAEYKMPTEGAANSKTTSESKTEQENISSSSNRRSQEAATQKAVIQAIARTLWYENPDLTIADILKHHATLVIGSGKLYNANYLRTYISEVDPRDKKSKRGRPKKNT